MNAMDLQQAVGQEVSQWRLSNPKSPWAGPVYGGTANVWSGAENQPPIATQKGRSHKIQAGRTT